MATLRLQGQITEEGELIVQLPSGLPAGRVIVQIEVTAEAADQSWTDDEIRKFMAAEPMSREDFITWLDTHPAPEPWGDLRDDEDAGEYVHRMRRQSTIWLDEPGENE
jgi:hypothetical protein